MYSDCLHKAGLLHRRVSERQVDTLRYSAGDAAGALRGETEKRSDLN